MTSGRRINVVAWALGAGFLATEPAWAAETAPATNPYGLSALWSQGDAVAKTTLVILVVMSLGTWYIGVLKFIEQAKLLKQGQEAKALSWQLASLPGGINELKQESAFRYIAQTAVDAASKHVTGQLQKISFSNWMEMTIQRSINLVNGRLQAGLPFLATVGSTAPFVGLFGTVWGIYHALTAIGMSGQASIDKVAGPVGEALIMTAIGLAVAVPAVLGYNWLMRRNKVAMEQVRHFSAELQMVLLSDR
ncbi:MAG: MotA/TolQ/ExbB proton channel family protein [Myxococcales bacterium]|nr:MAG: MotA/TolQ/ExbB proton channel family protein [Myxococcales bacterium]